MKLFGRSIKIASSLAAALMISAPLALAATPSFADTMHDGYRHDGDRYQRGDNYEHRDYRSGDRDEYRYGDRGDYRGGDRDGMRYERIFYRSHREHSRWDYFHRHHMWTMNFHGR